MLFRVIDTQYSELIILDCSSFISLRSVYRAFFINGIMIYFQSGREQIEYLVILL